MDKPIRQSRIIAEQRGGYNDIEVPFIRLRGRWLERAGFEIGDDLQVEVQDQRLVITKRAENPADPQ